MTDRSIPAPPPSTAARPLLVELQTEELPPKALRALGLAFADGIERRLRAHDLVESVESVESAGSAGSVESTASAGAAGAAGAAGSGAPAAGPRVLATPRRLAALVPGVRVQAPPRRVELKGPSVAVGLDAQGQPTMALRKWAERQQVGLDALERHDDGRQQIFRVVRQADGARLADVIGTVLAETLAALPVPKVMTYQLADGLHSVGFVRPAHHLVVLHGDAVVPCSVLGLQSGHDTAGHRFQGPAALRIDEAATYETVLREQGRVWVDLDARRAQIARQLHEAAAQQSARLSPVADATTDATVEALLDEVTALVENPAVYVGRFDREFLQVPPECLILTMRTNQKYFPLFDDGGRLIEKFLIVSNLAIDDPAAIIDGNERVVRPRLADARFFYQQDRRTPLADRVAGLEHVVYHQKLGSLAQRTARVRRIAQPLAALTGADPDRLDRAVLLAKADLSTGMVGEFPELQGIMGRYYAQADGEPADVAAAIAEHYQPRFSGDALPATATGLAAALADKLETLAGFWGIGQRPTGDRDPFALRRHALGVARILAENALPVPLDALLDQAFAAFEPAPAGFDADRPGLHRFVTDRLRAWLRERGHPAADIDAVLAVDDVHLDGVEPRLRALAGFRDSADFTALAAANKRIANILRKRGTAPAEPAPVRPDLLVEPAERSLHDAIEAVRPSVEQAFAAGRHADALTALAALRAPVDAFFEHVMVNAERSDLRENRLDLLAGLHRLMNRVADLGRA